ncbi:MAG: lysophospholipid acyltransferase family protein [Candidatus Neomarinimicrobiota bacterium]
MRFLWVLFNTVIWTLFFGLPGIFLTLFETNKGKILGYCARNWAKFILFFSGIRYSVRGLENIDSNSNYIFAGNHASMFDIPLAFAGLPYWLVPIAKIELKSVFILGWVMNTAGHIWVNRKKRKDAMNALDKARKSLIDKPRSILLFPEGTRTIDGSIGAFKRGGLFLSRDTNIPIVPIAFIGTYDLLNKNSFSMKGNDIVLHIGEPLPIEKSFFEDPKNFTENVRKKVKELL